MLRHVKKPISMEIPLYGYMYDTRKALASIAHCYGLQAWTTDSGPDEVLHMNGDAGKFKDVFNRLQKINHHSAGVWVSAINSEFIR